MPKPTIKSLEDQISNLRELREGDAKIIEGIRREALILKAENEQLKLDKTWLKSMHSNMLQATSEMFRNR